MKKANQNNQTRYFMYCRKSSDTEDRQVQSIEAQKRELLKIAKENGFEVIRIFEESQSAKKPGRPLFTEMIDRFSRGEANGLIAWKMNRLARNPIDGGIISWMLQQRIIKHVQTFGRSYYPEDNVIVMAVELGMANQFIKDLSVDTKRGLRERAENGYPNGVAPIGFLNDPSREPGNRGWTVDIDRFDLIKQLLNLELTGKYSIRKLLHIANEEMELRTPVRKNQGGKKLVTSYVESILKKTVYAGFFYAKDENSETKRYELTKSMPRMITEDQFWHIQKILGRKGKTRPSVNLYDFPYKEKMRCGTCQGSVTAEHKHQIICSSCKKKFARSDKIECPQCGIAIDKMENPKYLHYVFYHCTKRHNPDCPEGSLEEKHIDDFLASYFEQNLRISPALRDWCIKHLDELLQNSKKNEYEIKISLEKSLADKEKEQKELIRMKLKDRIDEDDYEVMKEEIKSEMTTLQDKLTKLGHIDTAVLERTKKGFDLAVGIAEAIRNGGVEEKRDMLSETCSNLELKDKNLGFYGTELFSIIIGGLLASKKENNMFEPANWQASKGKTEVFASVCPTLLRGQDSNL